MPLPVISFRVCGPATPPYSVAVPMAMPAAAPLASSKTRASPLSGRGSGGAVKGVVSLRACDAVTPPYSVAVPMAMPAAALASSMPRPSLLGGRGSSGSLDGSGGRTLAAAAMIGAALVARSSCRRSASRRDACAPVLAGAACAPSSQRREGGHRLLAAATAVDLADGGAGESRGILRSAKDLPKKQALGIELRRSSARAGLLSVEDYTVHDISHFTYELCDDAVKNQETIKRVLNQIVEDLAWKGVVGVTMSRIVADGLGNNHKEVVERALRSNVFVHTVSMSSAGAYYELVSGGSADEAAWRDKLVLVTTLGSDVEMSLLYNGKRCMGCRGPLCYDSVLRWRQVVGEKFHSTVQAPAWPAEEGPAWDAWVSAADGFMADAVREFQGDLDRIIVMPTSKMGRSGPFLIDVSHFKQLNAAVIESSCVLAFSKPKENERLMEGAALCALTELQTVQLMQSWKPALTAAKSLQALSDSQIRMFFDRLDADGNGVLGIDELVDALDLIGVTRDAATLQRELDISGTGSVDINDFVDWWMQNVNNAKVITLTSSTAWRELLERSPPEGYSKLVLLEVTFSFCRSCRVFEPTFQKFAGKYSTVRFVNLVGNSTIGAMELCTQELAVKASPAFFVFRRGGELLAQWTGKNPVTFKQRLEECLELEASGKSVAID